MQPNNNTKQGKTSRDGEACACMRARSLRPLAAETPGQSEVLGLARQRNRVSNKRRDTGAMRGTYIVTPVVEQ